MRFALLILFCASLASANTNVCHVAEGDSLTRGVNATGDPTVTVSSNYVKQMYLVDSWGVYSTNLGVSGDKIADNTAATRTKNALSGLTAYSRRIVTFLMMINDFAVGDSVATVTTNMAIWNANVRATYPDVKIMALTQFDANVSGTITGRVMSANNWLRTNLVSVGGIWDYVADTAIDSRLADHTDTTYFAADGVHLTDAGYAVMATIVRSNLVLNNCLNATYYVRKDGNDSNRGFTNTSSGAKLTIQNVADRVWLGDIVNIGAGNYAENVTVVSNGTASQMIQFIGAGQSTVTNYGWTLSGADYIRVSDLVLSNASASAGSFAIDLSASAMNNTFSNIAIYGVNNWVSGMGGVQVLQGATNNWFEKIFIKHPNHHYFTVAGNYMVVTNCTMTGDTGWDLLRVVASNVRIVGNTVTNLNNAAQTSGAVISGVTYGYVCTTCDGNFSNVGGGTSGSYVNGDSFTATSSGTPTSYGNVGLDNANHSDVFQAFGNDPADYSTNVTFAENYISACTNYQMGILTDDQEDGRIADWTFRNNLFVDVTSTMLLFAPHLKFYNNGFIRSPTIGSTVLTFGSSGAGHGTNSRLFNNIFYQCSEQPDTTSRGWYYSPDGTNGMVADYNLVIGVGAGLTKQSGMWNEGGRESHGLNGSDPLFAGATDFHPLATSPLIAAGTNLSGSFTIDIEKLIRTGTWWIGPYASTNGVQAGGGGDISSVTGYRKARTLIFAR